MVSRGFPGHVEDTNMDEKDIPDPFQALLGAETTFKHRNMMVLMVKIGAKISLKSYTNRMKSYKILLKIGFKWRSLASTLEPLLPEKKNW